MCRRLAGNEADALDATQEALIAIAGASGASTVAPPSPPGPTGWPPTRAWTSCDAVGDDRSPGLPDDLGHGDRTDLGAVSRGGIEVLPDRLAIDAALDQLSEEFRAPVVLRDLCDLDYAEIAADARASRPAPSALGSPGAGRSSPTLLDPGNQTAGSRRPTDRNDPGPRP